MGLMVAVASVSAVVRSAHANIRAPLVEARSPSSAALALDGAAGVEVLGETLTFRCVETACDVEARYRLKATAAVAVTLAFVLPSDTAVAVKVGTTAAQASVTAAAPVILRESELDSFERHALEFQKIQLLQATFSASLVRGENTIVVTYRQPLGREEHGHSYFRQGRWTQVLRYELWPLSEWRHAPGFRVDGQVVIKERAPSWWKRTFSKPRTVGCEMRGRVEHLAHARLEQRGDDLAFVFQLQDPLPPRLWCSMGDADLIPRP